MSVAAMTVYGMMMQRLWLVGVLAAVILGAALRLACLQAEFWQDEIWSWEFARSASSWQDIFVHVRHDNNHHLNTLWLFVCGDVNDWAVYRWPALAAGLLTIVLAAKLARRWGKADAVFAALLVAVSYWLVLSSTEARGYGLALCFALLALDALWRWTDVLAPAVSSAPNLPWEKAEPQVPPAVRPTALRGSLVLFWLASICGFLSHLTFVHAYLGFVVWAARRQAQARRPAREEIQNLLLVHGVPRRVLPDEHSRHGGGRRAGGSSLGGHRATHRFGTGRSRPRLGGFAAGGYRLGVVCAGVAAAGRAR
jgi:hypothetical protein